MLLTIKVLLRRPTRASISSFLINDEPYLPGTASSISRTAVLQIIRRPLEWRAELNQFRNHLHFAAYPLRPVDRPMRFAHLFRMSCVCQLAVSAQRNPAFVT